ncbi:hypothetical protein [Roseibacillus persicicus]|uniref:Uncharacterized protein n=1 Tax=Roseibacillus persicicus TaxID=454148 RepID=A0A918WL60_9BACT|nr:hypothetical protein [Roseibacillus persicicus]MDQ8191033.1 hypothetical protein [Roseibacillus persicicus]GHC56903.1 hypothetical protein GCM10007100_24650 [Roseibacillus persicicus]
MLPQFADYLEVFGSDERFFVFASSSFVLALVICLFLKGACPATRLLLLSAAFLIAFAFVVLAPLAALSTVQQTAELSPVNLNFNFGFLALGLGLMLKFRDLPKSKTPTPVEND